jgi:hypothetical protein
MPPGSPCTVMVYPCLTVAGRDRQRIAHWEYSTLARLRIGMSGVGVFREGEEILVGSPGLGQVSGQRERAAKLQVRRALNGI